MRIAVLHDIIPADAPPDQHDGLAQAQAVGAALLLLGHEPLPLGFPADAAAARTALAACAPDMVFNLVEAPGGKGSNIHLAPQLLEDMGLPFTGAGAAAMRLSTNKLAAKQAMRAAGVPTPDWMDLAKNRNNEPANNSHTAIPQRVIVKSVWEHASIGMDAASVLYPTEWDDILAALRARQARWGGEWFAEAFVAGREFAVTLLDGPEGAAAPQVLPPAEMLFLDFDPRTPRIIDYAAKWDPDSPAYGKTPRTFDLAPHDAALVDRLRDTALACWRVCGLSGYARVDFRVDAAGTPLAIDINANPCIAPDAGFAAALHRAGIGYEEAIARIVAAPLRRTIDSAATGATGATPTPSGARA
ncbi:MAG: D-alanine--D-alanine ligase [Desulfovibrionaceae bacterium]